MRSLCAALCAVQHAALCMHASLGMQFTLFWSVQIVSRSLMSKLMFQGMGRSALVAAGAASACPLVPVPLLPCAHSCHLLLLLLCVTGTPP